MIEIYFFFKLKYLIDKMNNSKNVGNMKYDKEKYKRFKCKLDYKIEKMLIINK